MTLVSFGVPTKKRGEPPSAATVRNDYFGPKAQDYDKGRETEEKWLVENEAVRYFLGEMGPGESIADIPCGTGRFLEDIQNHELIYEGFDVSEEMMAQARAKSPGLPIRYGDILDIPLLDKTVDHVLCIRLLEKLKENEVFAAFNEMSRVARKSFTFSLVTGPETQPRNRSWVHDLSKVETTIKAMGFTFGRCVVREPEYHIWHCVRK